jgi:hypothetical protein
VSSLYCANATLDGKTGLKAKSGRRVTAAYGQSLVAASLYVDYVFLDTDERRRMAQGRRNQHRATLPELVFMLDG